MDNLAWLGAGHHATVYNNANIGGPVAGVWSGAIAFNSEYDDTDAFHSPGANTRLTVPAGLGGFYLVSFEATMNGAAGVTQIGARIRHSTRGILSEVRHHATPTYRFAVNCGARAYANAAEYFTVEITSEGAGVTLEYYAEYSPNFGLVRIGA